MLSDVVNYIDAVSHQVLFVSSFLIFLGGGYIALHSRVMPKWAVTSLWYIGLAALLNMITLVIEWTVGSTHPFSHFQFGIVAEMCVFITLAVAVGMLFFHTVWQDYLGAKRRKQIEADAAAKKRRAPVTKPVARPKKTVKAKQKMTVDDDRIVI